MDERQTTMVFMNENERGARDSGWFGIKAFRYATNQGGLSRAKVPAQSQNLSP